LYIFDHARGNFSGIGAFTPDTGAAVSPEIFPSHFPLQSLYLRRVDIAAAPVTNSFCGGGAGNQGNLGN
jgi:hypothetical protein